MDKMDTIGTDELVQMLNERAKQIEHDRLLLINAAFCIHQLSLRLAKYEAPDNEPRM